MAGKVQNNNLVDVPDAVSLHRARQLALLGILLQGLHVLFGITAVIGVLVAHTKLKETENTPYHSHLRWQITTFWFALGGYVIGFYLWFEQQYPYVVIAVLAWVIYRTLVNLSCWRRKVAIVRIL